MTSSVDSIVTITTLAEDDSDLGVGRVSNWCVSFDLLLVDPLGVHCLLVRRTHCQLQFHVCVLRLLVQRVLVLLTV